MPVLHLNLDALKSNISRLPHLEKAWGFSLLPVLKMVAGHPVVARVLHDAGYQRYGVAEVDEALLWGSSPPQASLPPGARPVLISLPPPQRADDVLVRFSRSPVSSLEHLLALEAASQRLGTASPAHEYIVMLDAGEWREGIPLQDAPAFFQGIKHRFPHLKLAGVGLTMGCLHGVCPDTKAMRALADAVSSAEQTSGLRVSCISLGGSIFWDWLARNHDASFLPAHCQIELRAADPFLLGYDSYHDKPAAGGDFNRDLFRLDATVVEVLDKDIQPACHCVYNGKGKRSVPRQIGCRRRALLDCGSLHTSLEHCHLLLPGAILMDYCGTYCVLDITDCPRNLRPGDTVSFAPGYWAVAQSFRTPLVAKHFRSSENICHA